MITPKDIQVVIEEVDFRRALFGATGKFQREFQQRCEELGEVICREMNITKEEALTLPPEDPLPQGVEKHFNEFKEWLIKQHALGK